MPVVGSVTGQSVLVESLVGSAVQVGVNRDDVLVDNLLAVYGDGSLTGVSFHVGDLSCGLANHDHVGHFASVVGVHFNGVAQLSGGASGHRCNVLVDLPVGRTSQLQFPAVRNCVSITFPISTY